MDTTIDILKPLSQSEAGRAITVFKQKNIRIYGRELIGFSPEDASKIDSAKKYGLKPEEIARAAGRPEIVKAR